MIISLFLFLAFLWFWIAPKDVDSYVDMGNGYIYADHDICLRDSIGCLTLIIPDEVDDYMYDNHFIVAHQNPDFSQADYFWRFGNNYDEDSVRRLSLACFRIQSCYWIVCKTDGTVLGPLTKDSFDIKCQEQNVKIRLDPRYESDIE